jgi:hypothetical protein
MPRRRVTPGQGHRAWRKLIEDRHRIAFTRW